MALVHSFKRLLGLLPKNLRHEAYRRSLRLTYDWPEPLRIKLATTQKELDAAFELTGTVLVQHLMPQTAVIIALWNEEVVGTVTLIRENPLGFSIQRSLQGQSVKFCKGRGAELTCLEIDPKHGKSLNDVFFPLLKYTYYYARNCFGISGIVTQVRPKAVDMYQALLGLESIPEAPAGIMFVDLDRYLETLGELYAGASVSSDLAQYFAAPVAQRRFCLPDRDFHHVSDPVVSPRMMHDLFFTKFEADRLMTPEEKRAVAQQYPHENYVQLLGVGEPGPRSEWRFETRFPARIGLIRGLSEVRDVSPRGLKLFTLEKLEVGRRVVLRVVLNRSIQAQIYAEVRWASPDKLYGLRIDGGSKAWDTMTKALEARWLQLASGVSSAVSSVDVLA